MSERVEGNLDQLFAHEASFDASVEALFVEYRRYMLEPDDNVYSDLESAAQYSKQLFRQIAEYIQSGEDELFVDDIDHACKASYISGLLAARERKFRQMIAGAHADYSDMSEEEWFQFADSLENSLADSLARSLDEEDSEYEECSELIVDDFDNVLIVWNDQVYSLGIQANAGFENKQLNRKNQIREVTKIALGVAFGVWLAETFRRGAK